MGQILSQDEVDALLKVVEEGGVPAGGTADGGPKSVRALDLTNPSWALETPLPGAKPVAERFARALRVSLGGFFGQIPQVELRTLELVKYGALVEGLPTPVSLPLFRLAPLRGHGMLIVPPAMVGALL